MRARLVTSAVVFVAALAALAVAHALWISRAPRDPRFVRFMRRNNQRANADEVIPERGSSLGRDGGRDACILA